MHINIDCAHTATKHIPTLPTMLTVLALPTLPTMLTMFTLLTLLALLALLAIQGAKAIIKQAIEEYKQTNALGGECICTIHRRYTASARSGQGAEPSPVHNDRVSTVSTCGAHAVHMWSTCEAHVEHIQAPSSPCSTSCSPTWAPPRRPRCRSAALPLARRLHPRT